MQVQTNRIYAFDHMRATTMFLVLIAHACTVYVVTDLGVVWELKDPHSRTWLCDILLAFLAFITMPVFFLLSGFMSGTMFTEKGTSYLLKNRLNRIGYPLVVGLIILFPITALSFIYLKFSIEGVNNPFNAALIRLYDDQFEWRLFKPIHFWFLYYLMLFHACWWVITLLPKQKMRKVAQQVNQFFLFTIKLKASPLLFALVTFVLLCLRKQNTIEVPGTFGVNFLVFISYVFFFIFGWLLYNHKEQLARFKQGTSFFLIVGSILFIAKLAVMANQDWAKLKYTVYILAAINSVSLWFLIYGLLGLYLKSYNKYSVLGRYLSDASYWVYLVHFPVVIFFQGVFIGVNLNVYAKFLLVIAISFIITLVSYHYLVRQTFIGQFLNGKKHRKDAKGAALSNPN